MLELEARVASYRDTIASFDKEYNELNVKLLAAKNSADFAHQQYNNARKLVAEIEEIAAKYLARARVAEAELRDLSRGT